MSAGFALVSVVLLSGGESRTCETCVVERAYGAQDLFDAWAEAANTRQTVFLRMVRELSGRCIELGRRTHPKSRFCVFDCVPRSG